MDSLSPVPRRRGGETKAASNDDQDLTGAAKQEPRDQNESNKRGTSLVDILRMVMGLVLLCAALSWFITGESIIWNWRQVPTLLGSAKRWMNGPVMLTDAELALYNGTDPSKPIYVGVNGSVYDVTASPQTYGPGGAYSFFAGRDASRAFLTGCFQEDLTPDLRGVEDMFMPIDPPSDPAEGADDDKAEANTTGAKKSLTKGELKIRRERDLRVAKKKVREGIDHWVKVFSGETGRPYFYVGEIKREGGWLEKIPKRELCQPAKDSRPRREDVEKG